jgi:hypothetical protein
MSEIIRNFTAKLANHNYRVLWAEAVVLAVIIGVGFASWPGDIILLTALTWVLNKRWGAIYLIVLFSCAWGFLAGMIGFGLGGWAWALLLGILALLSGVKIHLRDLKRPLKAGVTVSNNVDGRQSLYGWRQNFN